MGRQLGFAYGVRFCIFGVRLDRLGCVAKINGRRVTSLSVLYRVLVFAFLRDFRLYQVVAFRPTDLVRACQLPAAEYVVLIRRAVLGCLGLRLSRHASGLASVRLVSGRLYRAFIRRLISAFHRLLLFRQVYILGMLRRLQ